MPQADDERRALMQKYFGNPVDYAGPTKYLKACGWKESSVGWWRSPAPMSEVTEKEYECFLFLRDEWDHDYEGVLNG